MNTAKKQATKRGSGYKLTHKTLNNLSQFKLTPTAKLVLIYLTSCYNENNKYVFPKQEKMAKCLGVSERSIVRAISELVKERLIIIECKYINHYKFTQRIVSQCVENLSDNIGQNDTQQDDNLTHHYIEPIHEPIKEPLKNKGDNVYSIEDEKILREYAIKHNAKNIQAYVNTLKASKSAENIIKQSKNRMIRGYKATERYLQNEKEYQKTAIGCLESQAFLDLRKKLKPSTL